MSEGYTPAFPIEDMNRHPGPVGLTKRELLAAMAMQGAMVALAIHAHEFDEDDLVDCQPIARDSVRMADALLKELSK